MTDSTFETEPLAEEIWQVRQMENPLLARALRRDITPEFLNMLKFKLDKGENINIDCTGMTRSGKTYGMYALGRTISNYTKIPFGIGNVLQRQSEYMNVFKTGITNAIYIVDEWEVGETQIGSQAEYYQEVDVQRIAAKRLLHRINLCGEETRINTNAQYLLTPIGRDFTNLSTKFLVYKLERGSEIPLGFIIIPLKPILCEEMITHKVVGCIKCPKYDTEECQREFPKGYEKKKDENIKRVAQENFNWRAKMRIEIAEELAKSENFNGLKKGEQIIYARNLSPKFTNRTLTEKEIEEIVTIARMALENPDILDEIKQKQPTYKPLDEPSEA